MSSKLKANALIYSLFIIVIVGVILTFFILLFYHSNRFAHNYQSHSHQFDHVNSGFEILLSKNPGIAMNSKEERLLFDEDPASNVILSRKSWGAYEVVSSSLADEYFSYSKTALLGSSPDEEQVFFLADHNTELKVAGKTYLGHRAYLPQKGISRAYISQRPYEGTQLLYGEKKESTAAMPKINVTSFIDYYPFSPGKLDSIVDFTTILGKDSLKQSFKRKTLVLQSKDGIYLDHQHFSGNIIFVSQREIHVSAGCKLQDVILIAPYLHIEEGFEGQAQFFACDSVDVEKNIVLEYPSGIYLVNDQNIPNKVQKRLTINENCSISGNIIVLDQKNNDKSPLILEFGGQTKFTGDLYCNGNTQLNGYYQGRILCNKLFYRTPATTYINHLIDTRINEENISPFFLFSTLFSDKSNNRDIIKWME